MKKFMAKDKLDDYEFPKIFEDIGIENYNDLEYLKKKLEELVCAIRNMIGFEFQQQVLKKGFDSLEIKKEKDKSIIENSLKEADEEIEKYNSRIKELDEDKSNFEKERKSKQQELNEYLEKLKDSVYKEELIRHYIMLKDNYLRRKYKQSNFSDDWDKRSNATRTANEISWKEQMDLLPLLIEKFKTADDVANYINFMENVDWNNRDVSSKTRVYNNSGFNQYYSSVKYRINYMDPPVELLDCKINDSMLTVYYGGGQKGEYEQQECDERIRVYNIGTFKYSEINLDYENPIVAVIKEDKDGNLKIYNGVIGGLDENPISNNPEFYAKIVFSDKVMENAKENNYGYIGNVEKYNGRERLIYNELGIDGLIESLYSTNNRRTVIINESLPAFYGYMDNIIINNIRNKQVDKKKFDKGGR